MDNTDEKRSAEKEQFRRKKMSDELPFHKSEEISSESKGDRIVR